MSNNTYLKKKEYYKERSRINYLLNRELRISQVKIWNNENYDKLKKYNRDYYYRNREEICEKKRKYKSKI
jgi:hypothetical protein